jgi:hypothetical protein
MENLNLLIDFIGYMVIVGLYGVASMFVGLTVTILLYAYFPPFEKFFEKLKRGEL